MVSMQCPKCNGGSFLSEEELVKVIESTEPHRIVVKAVYSCMACQEKFSRLVWDDLGPHRRHMQPGQPHYPGQPYQQAPNPYQQPAQQAQQRREEPVVDGLRFF